MLHIIGGHGKYGMLAMLLAEAGCNVIVDEPRQAHPSKSCPDNVRHQGAKEKARRLKRKQRLL